MIEFICEVSESNFYGKNRKNPWVIRKYRSHNLPQNCRVTKLFIKYLLPRALLFEKYIKKKIEKTKKY